MGRDLKMDYYRDKDNTFISVKRTIKRISRSFLVVSLLFLLAVIVWVVSNFYVKQFEPINLRTKMLDRCMDFINKEMDRILKHKTRTEQNRQFRQIVTNLPIKPIRMSTTTAVFKYTYTSTPVIIKRIIWNKNNGLNEDETCSALKGKSQYLVNALLSTRSYRMIPTLKDPKVSEKQTLIWIFFEYMDVKITDKHVGRSEDIIREIMNDALLGLKYLHDNNMAHLDIKTANIMGTKQKDGTVQYKLIDFGYTQFFPNKSAVIPRKNYGTYPYKAPEVIKKNIHGFASDVWALGASAWYLSLGNTLFYDEDGNKDDSEYMRFISNDGHAYGNNHRFMFREHTSRELINFVKSCMQIDYKKRPTVNQLLKHPFITEDSNIYSGTESYSLYESESESSDASV